MSFGITASSAVPIGSLGDSPYATAVLSDAPLLYLPLNESSGTTAADLSGNGRDGTYSNIILNQYAYIAGSSGRSVRTDTNTGSITVPYGSWMNTTEMTALLVCSTSGGPISMLASRYASDGSPSSNSWFVDISTGGTFYLYFRTSGGSDVIINSGVDPEPGKRYFIGAYIGAGESGIRVYDDDGVLIGSNTGAGGSINTSSSDLMLFSSGAGYGLIGYLDDFALFDTVLSTSRLDELAILATGMYTTWITKTEGTGARNGTVNHTITFPAAGAGALLVAIVAGPVTHTATTPGWVKQVNAVNFTEIAVFTLSATGGETSLAVTHNSSNFPIEWVVYEFAPGSSYLTGGGGSGVNFPTLAGLPGSNVTVFAAGSSTMGVGEPALTMNWWYFWRTEVNRNSLHDGVTGGVFFNVGRFALSDFPDATADAYNPTAQMQYDTVDEKVIFAIQHT